MNNRRVGAAVTAAAGLVTFIGVGGAAAADPELIYDVRVGSSQKQVFIGAAGETIDLRVYARPIGNDDSIANDGLQSGAGGIASSTGGLLGHLVPTAGTGAFAGNGAVPGVAGDFDLDGDMDIGVAAGLGRNHFAGLSFRSGSLVIGMPPTGFFVARARFTPLDLTGHYTFLNWTSGHEPVVTHWIDGKVPRGIWLDRIGVAAPLLVAAAHTAPEGDEVFVSGSLTGHLAVSDLVRPAEGQDVFVDGGVTIAASRGLMLGVAGASRVRIDDSASRNDGGWLTAGALTIGCAAAGTYRQDAGVTHVGAITLGAGGGTGTLIHAGGAVGAGPLTIGVAAPGVVRQSGGIASYGRVLLGVDGSSYELHGATSSFSAHDLRVAAGTAWRQSGGTGTIHNLLDLGLTRAAGAAPGAAARVEIDGGRFIANEVRSKVHGVTIVQRGGEFRANYLSLSSTNGDTYELSGGRLDVIGWRPPEPWNSPDSYLDIGSSAAGPGSHRFWQSGGEVAAVNLTIAASATYEMTGGAIFADWFRNLGTFVQSGGRVEVGGFSPGASYQMSGGEVVIGRGGSAFVDFTNSEVSLTVRSRAYVSVPPGGFLNGRNLSVRAEPGSLIEVPADFDPSQVKSFEAAGIIKIAGQPLVIRPGQSVWHGGFHETVTNHGLLSPGDWLGSVRVRADYVQSTSGVLRIEIGSDPFRSGFDKLIVDGTAFLDGTLEVAFTNGFIPHSGQYYRIIDAGWLNGTFANTRDGIVEVPGGTFDVIYDYDRGNNPAIPQGIWLTNFQARSNQSAQPSIPEPGTLLTLVIGATGFAARRRWRRREEKGA